MKKTTYKDIEKAKAEIERYKKEIEQLYGLINDHAERERAEWDEKSESWQGSERGEEEDKLINCVNDVSECLSNITDELESAKESIEEIMNDAPEGSFR